MKKPNNIQIFANPRGLVIPPCYGRSTPSGFESHFQFSLAESKRPSWQHKPVRGGDNHTHQGTHWQFALRQGKSHPPIEHTKLQSHIQIVQLSNTKLFNSYFVFNWFTLIQYAIF